MYIDSRKNSALFYKLKMRLIFKMSKSKITAIVFIILFVISLIVIGYLTYQKLSVGNLKEREEVLSAVSMHLSEEGYKNDDIKEIGIDYNFLKGGSIPYKVYVVFKKDPKNTYYYGWKSYNKDGIVKDGKNNY